MRSVELLVPDPAEPARVDMFVAANVHGLSRRRVKALIDAGGVRIGGRPVRKGGRSLRPGEVVCVTWRPSELEAPAPLERSALLASGEGWWAVHKPRGVPSHRSSEDGVGVPELAAEILGGRPDVRPAHRLDRETSGVLLLAQGAARGRLSEAFASRAVAKTYRAVVRPAPVKGAGELQDRDDQGREMNARFEVLARSADGSRAELAVVPREGRTHQVRIQLAAAGTPIVGDLVHGAPVPGGAPRMALHCEELRWGEHVVSCPPPPGWRALLEPPRRSQGAATGGKAPVSERKQRTSPREAGPGRAEAQAPRSKSGLSGSRRHKLRVSKATARILGGGSRGSWRIGTRGRWTGSGRGRSWTWWTRGGVRRGGAGGP